MLDVQSDLLDRAGLCNSVLSTKAIYEKPVKGALIRINEEYLGPGFPGYKVRDSTVTVLRDL